MRPAFGQCQNATVELETERANKLLEKRIIRVGWSLCRIQDRITVSRCSRCWAFGHNRSTCNGVDRTQARLKCTEEGHRVKERQNTPYCPICQKRGHRADSMACPVYRRESEKGFRKPSSNKDVRREWAGDTETDQGEVEVDEVKARDRRKATHDRKVDLGGQSSTSHDD